MSLTTPHIPSFVSESYWSLERSTDQGIIEALRARGLAVKEVDQRLQSIKDAVFNSRIREHAEPIIQQIRELSLQSRFAAALLSPLVSILSNSHGAATYNMVVYAHKKIHQVSQRSSLMSAWGQIGKTLSEFHSRFQSKARNHHTPHKGEWKELDALFEEVKTTWPAEVSSWQRMLASHRDDQSVLAIMAEWNALNEAHVDKAIELSGLATQTVLDGSERAWTRYERNARKLLSDKCLVCHKENDFMSQGPFTVALCKCARCRAAIYCGVECQRSDWLSHKMVCSPRSESRPEAMKLC